VRYTFRRAELSEWTEASQTRHWSRFGIVELLTSGRSAAEASARDERCRLGIGWAWRRRILSSARLDSERRDEHERGARPLGSSDRKPSRPRRAPVDKRPSRLAATIHSMVHDDDKLALDTQRLDVHLTSLQAEVEAKVRRVHRFREQMQQLDSKASGKSNVAQRERAARALIAQVDQMLETNLLVREMLEDLRAAADAVLADLLEG
jgi:hypothetical protein